MPTIEPKVVRLGRAQIGREARVFGSGKEATRFNEFVPPDRFAAALKKVN